MNEALKLEAVKESPNHFRIVEQSDKIKRGNFEVTLSNGVIIRSVALPDWKSAQRMLFIGGYQPEEDKKLIYIPSKHQGEVISAVAELNKQFSKPESEPKEKDESTTTHEDETLVEIKAQLKTLIKTKGINEIDLFALRVKSMGLAKKIRALKRAITAYEKEMRK